MGPTAGPIITTIPTTDLTNLFMCSGARTLTMSRTGSGDNMTEESSNRSLRRFDDGSTILKYPPRRYAKTMKAVAILLSAMFLAGCIDDSAGGDTSDASVCTDDCDQSTIPTSDDMSLEDEQSASAEPDVIVCPDGCDHATIQDGVDAAPEGGVVQVLAGTYAETVTVDKRLTLLGGPDVVLDGQGDRESGFILNAAGTTLSGFTVLDHTDIGVMVTGDDVILEDNTLTDNSMGIEIQEAAGTQVIDNHVADGSFGLNAEYAHDVQISGNTFTGHAGGEGFGAGVAVFFYFTVQSEIRDNIFITNEGGGFIQSNAEPEGSDLDPAVVISGNRFEENGGTAVEIDGGDGTQVLDNVIKDNLGSGILLWGSKWSDVRDNQITGNGGWGVHLFEGSDNNTFTHNEVTHNGEGGAFLDFAFEGTDGHNVVTENQIIENGGPGILGVPTASDRFTDNVIRDNAGPAVQFGLAVRDSLLEGNDLGEDGIIEVSLAGSMNGHHVPEGAPLPGGTKPTESLDLQMTAVASGTFTLDSFDPLALQEVTFEVHRDGEPVLSTVPGPFTFDVEPGRYTFSVDAPLALPGNSWQVDFEI